MKLLIYSDIQFNPWKEFSTILSNGRNSRLQDQLDVQEEIFQAAIANNVDILVHDGDLFESLTEKIDKATFLTVYEQFVKFSENNIIVVLNIGNHDWLDRTETSHILEPFKEIKNVIVADKPQVEIVNEVGLAFVPYTRDSFQLKVAEMRGLVQHSKKRYLFTHQGVSGAKVGPRDVQLKDEFTMNDFLCSDFTLVFNGHYHKTQKLWMNFIIIGSTHQKDFGERNDKKGYWILETDKAPTNPIYFETHAPKFFKVEVKNEEDFRLPVGFSDKDFLWCIVDADVSQTFLEVLRKITNIRLEVETKKEVKLRTDVKISMAVEEQIKRYVEAMATLLSKEKLLTQGIDIYRRSMETL